MLIYVIIIGFMLAGWLVSARLKSKFKKYAETTIGSGLSGQEIAEKMLRDHDIHDVKIISTEGQLTFRPGKTRSRPSAAVVRRLAGGAAARRSGVRRPARQSRLCLHLPSPLRAARPRARQRCRPRRATHRRPRRARVVEA